MRAPAEEGSRIEAEETASAAKTVHIALHHDAEHASFHELRIAR